MHCALVDSKKKLGRVKKLGRAGAENKISIFFDMALLMYMHKLC